MPRAVFYSKGSPEMMIHSENKPTTTVHNGHVVTKVSNDYRWQFSQGKLVLEDPLQIDELKHTPAFRAGRIVLVEEHELEGAAPAAADKAPLEVPGIKTKNDAIAHLINSCGASADELKGLKVAEVATLAKDKYNVVFVDWNG